MNVRPEEFESLSAAKTYLGHWIRRLEAGEMEKVVLVDRHTPRAVLVTVAAYEALTEGEKP